jgi:Arc/MetJ-type ribon-helix-helix transcriptional regulator
MTTDSKYATVSIPKGILDAIDELIEELGHWPSRGSFVREATLLKVQEEQKRLLARAGGE